MSLVRSRPRLVINSHGPKRNHLEQFDKDLTSGGCLTPDLKQTPPSFPASQKEHQQIPGIAKIGKYLIQHLEADTYKACDFQTKEEKICKVRIAVAFLPFF